MATGLSCALAIAPVTDIEELITKIGTMQSTISEAITEGEEEEEEGAGRQPRSPICAPPVRTGR